MLVDLSNSRHLRAAGKRPLDSKGNVIKLSVNSSISDNSNNREKYDTRAIADSFDGGKTWSITARCPMKDAAIRCEVAINPNNFDQMIYPDAFGEGSISFDGGKNWRKTNLKILSAVFSPVNSNIVWALGWEDVEIKLEQISNSNTNTIISNYNSAQNTTWNNSNIAWDKMTKSEWGIYLSRDGGRTFSLEIKDSNEHPLRFSILKSHPSDANILYYAESFFLTKYDLKSQVKSTHEVVQSREFLKIKEIIFSPANPSSVYLSFEVPVRTILN